MNVKLFAAALAALFFAGCGQVKDAAMARPAHPGVEAALQETLDKLVQERDFPGIQASVVLPDGAVIEAAAGLADKEREIPMTKDLRILSGSIGKTYVAAALMALVEEGKLDLDARVADYIGEEDWFQGFPNGETVKLGQLLNHSSGVPKDYLEHPVFLAALKRSVDEGLSYEEQGYTHEDYVRWVTGLEPAFAPGEGFHYSDAAYTVAALIVEKINGRPIEADIEERFLKPFKLTETEAQTRTIERFVSAYWPPRMHESFPGVPEKSVDMGKFTFDPKFEWGGGGYVSTSADLARWARIWFGGDALKSDYVAAMKSWGNPHVIEYLGDEYGVALQIRHATPFGERLYHGGYGLGFIARAEYLPDHNMASAIMLNTVDLRYELYHQQIWQAVLKAWDEETAAKAAAE